MSLLHAIPSAYGRRIEGSGLRSLDFEVWTWKTRHPQCRVRSVSELGGASRIRTGDQGFADPCLTAWLWRRGTLHRVSLPRAPCDIGELCTLGSPTLSVLRRHGLGGRCRDYDLDPRAHIGATKHVPVAILGPAMPLVIAVVPMDVHAHQHVGQRLVVEHPQAATSPAARYRSAAPAKSASITSRAAIGREP